MIKSSRMKCVGRVARVGEKINSYCVLWLNFTERNGFNEIGVNMRIILKWVFEKYVGEMRTVLFRLRLGESCGLL
jgi:hypothetical protein